MRKFLAYKTRSIWKGYSLKGTLDSITLNRPYVIKNMDIGKEVYIYNGKFIYKFIILFKHIGFKLGQFSLTKKLGMSIHLKNLKKKNKNNKNNKNNLKKTNKNLKK